VAGTVATSAPASATANATDLVLGLQRTAGNRAVNRLLARQKKPMTDEEKRIDELERNYQTHKRAYDWPNIAKFLNAYSEGDIQKRLEAFDPGELGALVRGARTWAQKDFKGAAEWNPSTDGRIRDQVDKHLKTRKWAAATASGKGSFGEMSVTKRSVSGNNYGMTIGIYFKPDTKKVNATEIAFIQVVRRVTAKGGDGTVDKPHLTKRKTSKFWFVDQNYADKLGWYGTGPQGQTESQLSPWVSSKPHVPAFMRDTPQGTTGDETFEAEAAAVARSGPDAGKVYGVVKWGFKADSSKQLTELPVTYHQSASADFLEACKLWNSQAAGDEHLRNATDQAALPAISN
jgi:hypothetical protein